MSETTPNKLAFFPVTLFGSILGYSGLTLGYIHAHQILGISNSIALALTGITTLFFIAIGLTYLSKLIKVREAVQKEFEHPVAMNFFPAISLGLMLMSLLYIHISPLLAEGMFYLGASAQLIFTFYIVRSWILHEKWEISQMTPAWFIPVVGNIVAPIAAVTFVDIEIAWFFFSIGLIFWLILLAIVMYRLFFHPPLLKVLEPTLFILIAPPAMGFLSYMALQGNAPIDDFARILYYTGLFFALLLFSQTWRFIKVPFSVSWWAYTFPISAIANASFVMYEKLHINLFGFFAAFFLSVLSALVLHLTMKTLWQIKHKQLCTPPAVPAANATPKTKISDEPTE